jgi:dipeptidase D
MNKLSELQPKEVFQYFEEICGIPHGSRNTKAISDYCVAFAEKHGLRYIQDQDNNVIIFKDGSFGYENSKPVILQGHLDMVCEKTPESTIDFAKDGLELMVEGDYVFANGTTLGGDDGIAVAYILAILASSDIPHPPIEAVLTIDEEIGLLGAASIDLSMLKGKMLMNIDSEEEGILLTSCAGGATIEIVVPMEYSETELLKYEVVIHGLKGGHSGVEIDKCRANSNILMGRLLYGLSKEICFSMNGLEGGLKDNAIPNETKVNLYVQHGAEQQLEEYLQMFESMIRNEYKTSDTNIQVDFNACGLQKDMVLDGVSQTAAIYLLMNVPNGIQSMCADIPGLVESSLNLGILKTTDKFSASFSVRSSVASLKEVIIDKLTMLAEFFDGTINRSGDYPAWEYKKDSHLRDVMVEAYKDQYGEEPKIEAIHAGLECGMLSGKIDDLDCVSFGPNMYDIHTVKERLSISSTKRTWDYILEILKRLK